MCTLSGLTATKSYCGIIPNFLWISDPEQVLESDFRYPTRSVIMAVDGEDKTTEARAAPPVATKEVELVDFGGDTEAKSSGVSTADSTRAPSSPSVSAMSDSEDAMSTRSRRSLKDIKMDRADGEDDTKEKGKQANSVIRRPRPDLKGDNTTVHKFTPVRREWVWTKDKGWFEAGVEFRIDMLDRRGRSLQWSVVQKSRQGRKQREKKNKAVDAERKKKMKDKEDGAAQYRSSRSTYHTRHDKFIKSSSGSSSRGRSWNSSRRRD